MELFSFVFFLVLFSLTVAQKSGRALFTGLLLLFFCFLIFFLLSLISLTWYGLLFFLIYVGGLLVLFFYVFSVKSNPGNFNFSSNLFFVLFFIIIFFFFFRVYISLDFSFRNRFEDQSYFLFNRNECYLMLVLGWFLLFVLFVIKKILFDIKGAIRPIKF